MDDSVKSGSRLEVSVSFGRFENDTLSWEKWSSFSPNKYLEEVGNLSTPGSVAQKKAYFEAHYKKIAARKAEELEQEKSNGPFILGPIAPSKEDCFENSPEIKDKFDLSNGEKLDEEFVKAESNETTGDNSDGSSEGDEQKVCTNGFVDVINSDDEQEDVSDVVKCGSSKSEEARDELNVNVDEPELNVGKDSLPVVLETPQKDSQDIDIAEKRPERKIGRGQTSLSKKENSKSNARNITQKVTPTKKESNSVGTKKKNGSPVTKPMQAATPRYSKPKTIPTPISASQSSKKKANGSQLPKSNNILVGETKKNAPTSLHMSLSLGPQNSLGSLSMTRKSLIMERMGDKDIVKRAFKTFQNRNISGSTADEKPSTAKHVSSAALEPKVSTFHTPTKRSIGPRKDTEKTATPRSHPGTKSNPLPSGLHKSSAPSRKNTTAFSPSTGLKSDEKSEKRKAFMKKLEAKSIARVAANAQLSAKSRVGVANEIHQRPTLSR